MTQIYWIEFIQQKIAIMIQFFESICFLRLYHDML